MRYLIDKFVLWWVLREWDLEDGSMDPIVSDQVLAEIGMVDDVNKYFKLRLRRLIKYLALKSEGDEMIFYRGRVKELQSLARASRDTATKFRKLHPKSKE